MRPESGVSLRAGRRVTGCKPASSIIQAYIVLLLPHAISLRLIVFHKIRTISSHRKHDFAGYITRYLVVMMHWENMLYVTHERPLEMC